MAARRSSKPESEQTVEFTSGEQISRGIERLGELVREIEKLREDKVGRKDPRVDTIERDVRQAVAEIFGKGSFEYGDFQHFSFWPMSSVMFVGGGNDYGYESRKQAEFDQEIPKAIGKLQGLISGLERRRRTLPAPIASHTPHALPVDGFDTAQVCLNGHIINFEARGEPSRNKAYCTRCGEKTISECTHCGSWIQGRDQRRPAPATPEPPGYCHACGKPYPWTVAHIESARALADELGLGETDLVMLKASLEQMAVETPKTAVGFVRFKKVFAKATGPMRELFLDAVAKFAVESVKTGLGGM